MAGRIGIFNNHIVAIFTVQSCCNLDIKTNIAIIILYDNLRHQRACQGERSLARSIRPSITTTIIIAAALHSVIMHSTNTISQHLHHPHHPQA